MNLDQVYHHALYPYLKGHKKVAFEIRLYPVGLGLLCLSHQHVDQFKQAGGRGSHKFKALRPFSLLRLSILILILCSIPSMN